jgi:hypothetical protein
MTRFEPHPHSALQMDGTLVRKVAHLDGNVHAFEGLNWHHPHVEIVCLQGGQLRFG